MEPLVKDRDKDVEELLNKDEDEFDEDEFVPIKDQPNEEQDKKKNKAKTKKEIDKEMKESILYGTNKKLYERQVLFFGCFLLT